MHRYNTFKGRRACAAVTLATCLTVGLLGAGAHSALAYELVDFAVLNDQANPTEPHEVFFPPFENFEMEITGTFDTTKCYRVKLDQVEDFPDEQVRCGSRAGSGNYVAHTVEPTFIRVHIAETSSSNFRNGFWEITVKENEAPGCTGSSTDQIHPIRLRVAGCTDYCLLAEPVVLTPDPPEVGCGGTTQLCVTVGASSGNLRYEWDLDGDGQYDDRTTFLATDGNCINESFAQTTQVGVRVVDQGSFVPDCFLTTDTTVTMIDDCDDGVWCNGEEICEVGVGCVAGTPPDCDDDIACTEDSCDEENDRCVNAPDDTVCDDGLWCNGEEICEVGVGCVAGTPPDCDDDIACTEDSCDEENDRCVNAPDDTVCDDGLWCNGEEICEAGVGCVAGTPPDCDDDVACTDDSCDEEDDVCVSEPDDAKCDDGDVCTIDTCDPETGCEHVFDDTDSDGDEIPDCISCPPLDVVFVMDTSGTMSDEAEILCENIDDVIARLALADVELNATIWGITQAPGGAFSCLTDTVANALGTVVPGNPPCCPSIVSNEDWALATAIVAEGFPWEPGAIRVIVPLGDEGPLDGDPCQDPGGDRDAITHAIDVAWANGVLVTPITGDGSSACVIALAEALAAGTGGDIFASTEPAADVAGAIEDAVVEICREVGPTGGIGDGDDCPLNPDKAEPGVCGCNLPDVDRDANGVMDCLGEGGGEPAPQPPPGDAACGACGAAGAGLYSLMAAAYVVLLFVRRRRR
jgi:hypothetical protein